MFLACLAVSWNLGWIELGWKSLVTSATFIRDYVNRSDWWTGHSWSLRFRPAMPSLAAGSSLENVCISYLLLYTVQIPPSLAGRLLNLRLVAHIGQISYSLYLWQQAFLTVLNKSVLSHFPLNLIAALGAAELSWWLVEKPSLALRHRWETRGKKARILAASAERLPLNRAD